MPSFLRHLVSIACVLAFIQGAVAQCAGWQATPQARLDCCQDGQCPLHHSKDKAARAQITQAAADDCCAQSQDQESGTSVRIAAAPMPAVVASVAPVVLKPAAVRPATPWEQPSPPEHVPKYLRLSVLLV